MNKRVLIFFASIALFFCGYVIGTIRVTVVHAQGSSIPKSWGTCKGTYTEFLIFEAADGTIRLAKPGSTQAYTYNRY